MRLNPCPCNSKHKLTRAKSCKIRAEYDEDERAEMLYDVFLKLAKLGTSESNVKSEGYECAALTSHGVRDVAHLLAALLDL